MPRTKVSEENRRRVFPVRLRRAHSAKLRELAKAFRISPGEWIEAQLDPYMPKPKA